MPSIAGPRVPSFAAAFQAASTIVMNGSRREEEPDGFLANDRRRCGHASHARTVETKRLLVLQSQSRQHGGALFLHCIKVVRVQAERLKNGRSYLRGFDKCRHGACS